jgi:hypothetical protein
LLCRELEVGDALKSDGRQHPVFFVRFVSHPLIYCLALVCERLIKMWNQKCVHLKKLVYFPGGSMMNL